METERDTVAVIFNGSTKRYTYFCKYPVRIGDHVVVDTPFSGYTCAKVVDILPNGSVKATKPVIQVVDDSNYRADLERQQRIAEIEAKLKKRAQEYSKHEFYRQLAANDAVAKELFTELESLVA